MWKIWTNKLLPKALKSCQKSNKLPNQVTLFLIQNLRSPFNLHHQDILNYSTQIVGNVIYLLVQNIHHLPA